MGVKEQLVNFPNDIQKAFDKIDNFIKTLGTDIQLNENQTMMGYYRYNIGRGNGFVWVKPTPTYIHLYLTQAGSIYLTPASSQKIPYELPAFFQPIRGRNRLSPNGYGGNTEVSFYPNEIENNFDIVKSFIEIAYKLRK